MELRTENEIMQNWEGATTTPLVSIRCITYNHENYIRDALNGFLDQVTTFPFEVLVHDDASTDDTATIIREYEKDYPTIIKPIYEIENQYSKRDGSIEKMQMDSAKGKYIAFCEGDDYWIDSYKLQKQVTFLEANPSYGLCYTKVKNYVQRKQALDGGFGGKAESFDDLIKGNTIPTLSVCARKQFILDYIEEIKPWNREWLMGDYPKWLWFSYNSKIKFMPFVSSVYRVLEESASHSQSIEGHVKFAKSYYEIKRFFTKRYKNVDSKPFDEHIVRGLFFATKGFNCKAVEEFRLTSNKTLKDRLRIYMYKSNFLYKFYCILRHKTYKSINETKDGC